MAATKKVFEKVTCDKCVFWHGNKRGETGKITGGDCRKGLPVMPTNGGTRYGDWPITSHTDWCGEGRTK